MAIDTKTCCIFGGGNGKSTKKISKLKKLLHLTECRIAILKKQRRARYKQARDDLIQLVQLGHRDRALLRAELVIREQNMLDTLAILEDYCHFLTEKSTLITEQNPCPDELREAVSSLVYASYRLADIPELCHVRTAFSSIFDKDFTNATTNIHNYAGVNHNIIQKLSRRSPSQESRAKIITKLCNTAAPKKNASSIGEDEEDIELYFNNSRLYPEEDEEEEDTFELPRNYLLDEDPTHFKRWIYASTPSPLHKGIISGRRNGGMSFDEDVRLSRTSCSSETMSCQSEIGRDENVVRKAVSVRTRRGVQR